MDAILVQCSSLAGLLHININNYLQVTLRDLFM